MGLSDIIEEEDNQGQTIPGGFILLNIHNMISYHKGKHIIIENRLFFTLYSRRRLLGHINCQRFILTQ